MGAAVSCLQEQSEASKFEIFKELRLMYEREYLSTILICKNKDEKDACEALKSKLETLILDMARERKWCNSLVDKTFPNSKCVGDVVRVDLESGQSKEGVVIGVIGSRYASVDTGDGIEDYPMNQLVVLKSISEFEIGDYVRVRPEGMSLFFTGNVSAVNLDGTFDVCMEGEDDDYEVNVTTDRIHKVESHRRRTTTATLQRQHWEDLAQVFMQSTTINELPKTLT